MPKDLLLQEGILWFEERDKGDRRSEGREKQFNVKERREKRDRDRIRSRERER